MPAKAHKGKRAPAAKKGGKDIANTASATGMLICSGVLAVAAVLYQLTASVALDRAATKPYTTWAEFYPFYITEHSDVTNKQLHFIGTSLIILVLVLNPRAILAAVTAALLGLSIAPLCVSMTTGLVEMGVMVLAFLLLTRITTGRWVVGVGMLLCGYSFAWAGHFFFQHNKPATFVYPIYSLLSDFFLWFEIASGRRPFFQ